MLSLSQLLNLPAKFHPITSHQSCLTGIPKDAFLKLLVLVFISYYNKHLVFFSIFLLILGYFCIQRTPTYSLSSSTQCPWLTSCIIMEHLMNQYWHINWSLLYIRVHSSVLCILWILTSAWRCVSTVAVSHHLRIFNLSWIPLIIWHSI